MTTSADAPALARVMFEACPLCDAAAFEAGPSWDVTAHPLFVPGMDPRQRWRRCLGCGHVFTEGYWPPEVLAQIFAGPHPGQMPGDGDVEHDRQVWAPIVERLHELGAPRPGRWLDVGFGNGALMTTAEEFGDQVVGLDLRAEVVERMRGWGYDARCATLEATAFEQPFDVVVLADVLEHTPHPGAMIAAAARAVAPGGLLFVSTPNLDSFAFRMLSPDAHPYWGEIEHFHGFGRERLYDLLASHGLEAIHYAISQRYVACMEVVARRAGSPPTNTA